MYYQNHECLFERPIQQELCLFAFAVFLTRNFFSIADKNIPQITLPTFGSAHTESLTSSSRIAV